MRDRTVLARRFAVDDVSLYSVAPFSGANFHKNNKKTPEGTMPCAICGKPVVTENAKHWSRVVDGGSRFTLTSDDCFDGSGDMGCFPVGNDCHRKYKIA
jgi:hypothetical protein